MKLKSEELSEMVADLNAWKEKKVFSGKLHFNLIDLSERMEK